MVRTSLKARILLISTETNQRGELGLIIVAQNGFCWEIFVKKNLANSLGLEKGTDVPLHYQLQANLKKVKPGSAHFRLSCGYRVGSQRENAPQSVIDELWPTSKPEPATSGLSTTATA